MMWLLTVLTAIHVLAVVLSLHYLGYVYPGTVLLPMMPVLSSTGTLVDGSVVPPSTHLQMYGLEVSGVTPHFTYSV